MKYIKIDFYRIVSLLTFIAIILSFVFTIKFLSIKFKKSFAVNEKMIQAQAAAFDMGGFEKVKERMGW